MIRIQFEDIFPEYVHSGQESIIIPVDSADLESITDSLRIKDGKIPFFREDDKGRQDLEAWYEFRLIVNRETGEPQEVEAWAENMEDVSDDNKVYHIALYDEERLEAEKELERQLELCDMTFQELAEIE